MKYTIAGILIVVTSLLVWIFRTGTLADGLIMVVAIISVTFFASLGNIWSSLYPAQQRGHRSPTGPASGTSRGGHGSQAGNTTQDGQQVILVKNPHRKT